MSYIKNHNLQINSILYEFINKEVLPGTNIKSDDFWSKFEKAVHELSPINKSLIQKREEIQKKIDE
jgi:Malate synthase